jgi:hypothetical protein
VVQIVNDISPRLSMIMNTDGSFLILRQTDSQSEQTDSNPDGSFQSAFTQKCGDLETILGPIGDRSTAEYLSASIERDPEDWILFLAQKRSEGWEILRGREGSDATSAAASTVPPSTK